MTGESSTRLVPHLAARGDYRERRWRRETRYHFQCPMNRRDSRPPDARNA